MCVSIKFDKAKVRMSDQWKFDVSLLDKKDFLDHLEQILKRKLTGAIIGNSGVLILRI